MVVPPGEASRNGSPQSVLLASIQLPYRGRSVAQLERHDFKRCLVVSKKQLNRTTFRDLTKTTRLSILGTVVSARRLVNPGRLAD